MRPLILAVIATYMLGWPQMAQQQTGKTAAPKKQTDTDTKPVPPMHIVVEEPIPAIHGEVKTSNAQQAPIEKPLPQFLAPEWVIVYVTAVYTLFALLQWRAIRRQANSLDRQIKETGASSAAAAQTASDTLAAIQKQATQIERQAGIMEQQGIDNKKSSAESLAALNHQITAMESHVQATRDNAEAAKLAAQAVINSERPWMAASVVERAPVLLYTPEAGDPIVYSQGSKNVFGVKFSSVGRTPARVMRSAVEYVKIDSLSHLPDEPQFSEITTHNGLVLIPDGEPFGFVAFLKPKPMLSKTEVRAIATREAFVYAYGFVEYICVFKCGECPHVLRFGYVYNFPQGGEPPALTGFMPGGPVAYNQST